MKNLLSVLAAASAMIPFTYGADQYSVFKICEDKHVLHTSDGADAGHIEYLVTDPAQQSIVSAVCTGGVLADRLVPVPYSDFAYGSGTDIVINFDRQRLVSAPVIEQNTIISGNFDPGIVDRSTTYFGGRTGRPSVQANGAAVERGAGRAQPSVEGNRETVNPAAATDDQRRPGIDPKARNERNTDPNLSRDGRNPAETERNRDPEKAKAVDTKNSEASKEETESRAGKAQPNVRNATTDEADRNNASVEKRKTPENGVNKSEPKAVTSPKEEEPSVRASEKTSRPETRATGETAKGSRPPEKSEKTEGVTTKGQ